MRWQVILMSFVIGAALTIPCSADLITNGDFEIYDTNNAFDWGITKLALTDVGDGTYTSTTALPGWTVTRNGDSGFAWLTSNVKYSGALALNFDDCVGRERIFQSFAVAAGTTYSVSYYEKYRDTSGQTLQAIISAASGTLILGMSTLSTPTGSGSATLTQTTLGTSDAFANYTFTFTPSESTVATLTFQSDNVTWGAGGTVLDNVGVMSIPEPCTLMLLATGLLGLLAYAWRTQK